jgi:hypothetical protein
VRAGEIKPLVAALSKAAGALVELWRGVDHTLAWPTEETMTEADNEGLKEHSE